MKTYTFPTGGSLGKWESWEGEVDFELTDEEVSRMKAAILADPDSSFSENEDLADIYQKVRAFALAENLKAMESINQVEELRRSSMYDGYTDLQIADEEMGSWSVSFPEEFRSDREDAT